MDDESSKRIKLESILHDQRLNLNLYNLSLKDLREITNGFSDERLIGQGSFGRVYKGLLQNGDIIAVKKLTSAMPGLQDKQYENEVHHLMRLIHPNIVQLVGYCTETEKELVLHNGKYVYAEKSDRLLCLEYMPKGSLRNHISDASSGLDWCTRYKIIVGICYGLHYLHKEWQPSTPIIHRDLKPANILLDDNMMPKIADFGLSRLFGEDQTRTTTKNFDGTLGYMAPEYLNRGIITKELDIFSLGVIIIQIVTGHKHYPYKDEISSQGFIDLVLKKWRNRLKKVPGYTSQEYDCRQIKRCVEIGLLCVKFERGERPTTSQIIEMLTSEDAECSTERERNQSRGRLTIQEPHAATTTTNLQFSAGPVNAAAAIGVKEDANVEELRRALGEKAAADAARQRAHEEAAAAERALEEARHARQRARAELEKACALRDHAARLLTQVTCHACRQRWHVGEGHGHGGATVVCEPMRGGGVGAGI